MRKLIMSHLIWLYLVHCLQILNPLSCNTHKHHMIWSQNILFHYIYILYYKENLVASWSQVNFYWPTLSAYTYFHYSMEKLWLQSQVNLYHHIITFNTAWKICDITISSNVYCPTHLLSILHDQFVTLQSQVTLMARLPWMFELVLKFLGKKSQNWTLKCLSIGTPKSINFPFVPNGKLMDFRCPNIQAHHNYAAICLNCGTPKSDSFSILDKWKINYFRCPNT